MDATETAVIRLHEQGLSDTKIAQRLGIGYQKVARILINSGLKETDESKMLANGKSVSEIAAALGKSEKAVISRIPYTKGMYGAEYPTVNAIRIRKSRERRMKNERI